MSNQNTPTTGFTLSNSAYDKLKFLVTIVLPALAAAYIALSGFWGLPKVEEVAGSITVLATFLGITLGVSSKNYPNDPPAGAPVGDFVTSVNAEGVRTVKLDLDTDPEDFIDQDLITFRLSEKNLGESETDLE